MLDRIILTYVCCSDRDQHFPVLSDVARFNNKILVTAKREVSEFLCDYTIISNYTFLCTLDSNFPTFAHLLINIYQFLHSLQDIKGIQGIDHHPFDN